MSSELASVALDWKTFRNVKECSCSTPFDHFSRKVRVKFTCIKVDNAKHSHLEGKLLVIVVFIEEKFSREIKIKL